MSDYGAQIIEMAKEMGATMAGIASTELLKNSPSHEILRTMGTEIDGVASAPGLPDFDSISWPAKAKSTLVIAISVPEDEPELDWADESGYTSGNRILMRINRDLAAWIEEMLSIKAHPLPYWVENGGLYHKDAAVLAGLGCIGRNNLLITPQLGPRLRPRAMLLEDELTPTGPIDFDPCGGCDEPCRKVCPQDAFGRIVHTTFEMGVDALPGRDGSFSRAACMDQMAEDVENAGIAANDWGPSGEHWQKAQTPQPIKWCRRCEFACPVGR
jgi:epoxyqueuosine reductase